MKRLKKFITYGKEPKQHKGVDTKIIEAIQVREEVTSDEDEEAVEPVAGQDDCSDTHTAVKDTDIDDDDDVEDDCCDMILDESIRPYRVPSIKWLAKSYHTKIN